MPERPKTSERGYGWRWQKASKTFLSRPENVLCRYCSKQDRFTVATVVDHIKPHHMAKAETPEQKAEASRLFWDSSNWQPLCTPCHSSLKQREERGKAQTIGADGWPIE